ncbi:hypothetical protein PA05_0938 [Cutibacterium acnes P05]|nr:hypothetical protein [Cutibacterium acnes P05]
MDTVITLAYIYASFQMDMRLVGLNVAGDDEVPAIGWRMGCE